MCSGTDLRIGQIGHGLVGWAKKTLFFEIQKKGFLNPGKSAKNIFLTDFGWLPVTTAVQPRDKGHEKLKFNKIDVTFDTLSHKAHFGLKMLRSTKIVSAS